MPEVILVIGLGLFAATEPHAAASAFKSTTAVVIMGTVAVVWVAVRAAALLVGRWPVLRVAVFTVAALGILKVVVLPAYIDHTVVEALPVEPAATSPASAPHAAPVKERAGTFRGIGHRAQGSVVLYRQPDSRVLVGLEQFDIQPGPAYAVYLVPGADREDRDGGTRLADLRGNRGTQFYEAPPSLDVGADPWTVLVWCETFDVPVANATPSALE